MAMVASVLKQIRNTVAIAALAVSAGLMAAGSPAMAFNVDGFIDCVGPCGGGGGDEYTNETTISFYNEHGEAGFGTFAAPLGTATLAYTQTGSMVYFGVSLNEGKNNIWASDKNGTGLTALELALFDGYGTILDYSKATGSEKGFLLTSDKGETRFFGNYGASTDKGADSISGLAAGAVLASSADSVDYMLDVIGCTETTDCIGAAAQLIPMTYEAKVNFLSIADASAFVNDLSTYTLEVHLSPPNCVIPGGGGDSSKHPDCGGTPPGGGDPPNGIPEPSTLAVFGLGLAGLGFMRRRKRTV